MAPTQTGEMDQMEQEKRQAMAEFRRVQSSRSTLLSISISFFFFLLSFSAWFPCLLHHADVHFSLLLIHLPDSFLVDRKTMFFLCNLILVVIFRDSGLLASFVPEKDPSDGLPVRREGHRSLKGDSPMVNSVVSTPGLTLQVLAMDKGSKPEEEEQEEVVEEEEVEEEKEEVDDGCPDDMDELNKKFDDFIEKFKRDRKLEALQKVLV